MMVDAFKVKVLGYCEIGPAEIARRLIEQGPRDLADLRGEYTIVAERASDVHIVNARFGAIQYFYTVRNGRLYHGETVLEILRAAGLGWEWNWRALGDLCSLEHLTESETLHRDISQILPGSVLSFHDGQLLLESRLWIDSVPRRPADPEEALEAFNDEVRTWATEPMYLSLSGGFDSRVILSSLLKQGIRPRLITMGSPGSSDVRVAKQIAETFQLEHRIQPLEQDDFLGYADTISSLTNGTKPACHWHTYHYAARSGIERGAAFYAGTLGEFARSLYFDKGILARLANCTPHASVSLFWQLKLRRNMIFTPSELSEIAPELRAEIDPPGQRDRARRLTGLCHGRFLSGLSRFYLEQRLPHFYANGVKLYLDSVDWRSPFHSRGWIDAVWNLGDAMKLGSNWHRFAIARNFPKLLEFQEERGKSVNRMTSRAPLLYWTELGRRIPYETYDASSDWFRSQAVRQLVESELHHLSGIVSQELVMSVLDEHCSGADRNRTLAFLLALLFWIRSIQRTEADSPPPLGQPLSS